MTSIKLPSPCINSNLPHTFTLEDNSTHLRDMSSSYLGATEETLSIKAGNSIQNSASFQINLGRKKTKVGELDIFGAEKYFNGGIDGIETLITERGWKESPKKGGEVVLATKLATSSACSEASGNSQSLLLQDVQRDTPLNGKKPAIGNRLFHCKCFCSGKNSVDVEKNAGEKDGNNPGSSTSGRKQIQQELWRKKEIGRLKKDGLGVGLNKVDCLAFPTLNPVEGNLTVGRRFEEGRIGISFDVFGSAAFLGKEDLGYRHRRSLTTLMIDPGTGGAREDDLGSESSSDLFEIESISTNTHPFFQEEGYGSRFSAPTTCYEPSEASIEWSVVTASAANFSIASDYSDRNVGGLETNKAPEHKRPSLLLGCVSNNAVKVVANTSKMKEKARTDQFQCIQMGNGVLPVVRYHTENDQVMDFELARSGHAFAARSHHTYAPHFRYKHDN